MAEATTLRVPIEPGVFVLADLTLPPEAKGLVIFAHGSGSGRTSPRNQRAATVLQSSGIATLLLDLLTPEEAKEDELMANHRFDIRLLTERLLRAITWASTERGVAELPLGLYGASTGGAAALRAAAAEPHRVQALVLRGARADLASEAVVRRVRAPTLLLVGGNDPAILEINRVALPLLPPSSNISVVPGATHLFEEKGALEEVGRRSAEWFLRHFAGPSRPLPIPA